MGGMRRLASGIAGPFTQEARPFPNPAAGAGLSITVPGGELWHLRTLAVRLVTSAAVANRTLALTVSNQTSVIGTFAAQAVITAGLTTDVTWMGGATPLSSAIVANALLAPAPELVLQPGWQLQVAIGAVDAADQLSRVVAWIDRLDQPPWLLPLMGTPEQEAFDAAVAADQ